MNDFSIGMALFDYIPVIFFALGAIILLRDMRGNPPRLRVVSDRDYGDGPRPRELPHTREVLAA